MRRLSDVLKKEFGEKVYKLALTSGCTCPNRDGTVGLGGCTFCSESGSGDFAAQLRPLSEQIEEAKQRIRNKTDAAKFIAYFQSYSNTYGKPEKLEALYREVLEREDIAVLSLATRPDCLGCEVMEMLANLSKDYPYKPIWLELGLQTIRDDIAEKLNRGYPLSVFEEGYKRAKAAGCTVVVHIIFGLPGESREDMLNTVRYLADLTPELDGIKIHMLHVMRHTALGEQYLREPFPLLTLEEYADLVAESLMILPEDTVLHRMTGDAPKSLLIAPDWTWDKKRVLNTLNHRIREYEMRMEP